MAAFQFRFMDLAVDVINRRGPSNKMHRQLQPKNTKLTYIVMLRGRLIIALSRLCTVVRTIRATVALPV